MVTEEDILNVAASIFMDIDGDTIEWVMQNYDSYQSDEPYSNQMEIVERMLYQISEWRG